MSISLPITIIPILKELSNGILNVTYAEQVNNSQEVQGQTIRTIITVYPSSTETPPDLTIQTHTKTNAGNQLADVNFQIDLKQFTNDLSIFSAAGGLLVTVHIRNGSGAVISDNSPNILLHDSNPPVSQQNKSLIVDLHDGHFISGILSEPDFNQLFNIDNFGKWHIIEHSFTSENITDTFNSFLNRINTHIGGHIEPEPQPTATIMNEPVIVGNKVTLSWQSVGSGLRYWLNQPSPSPEQNITNGIDLLSFTETLESGNYIYHVFVSNADGTIFSAASNNISFTISPSEPVPNTGMVSQSLGAFELTNDRLTGEILFIANTAFDPFFYGKTIFSFLSIKDPAGVNLVTKQNDLIFTEFERDERIFFDEGAFNNTELHMKAFVFSLDHEFNSLAFSEVLEFTIKTGGVPDIKPSGSGNIINTLIKSAPLVGIAALFLNSARKTKR